ncbi:MAG: histone H1 [Sphingobacterium sp.]
MEKFKQLKNLIKDAETEALAFYDKGNKSAGTRLRNALQQTKIIAQEIRNDVTAIKNSK